ncbi:MAG: LemA family protein [Erysipelothrix sp.]|nr:LemA family protein [Erysipelothrix sp.]
MELFIIVLVILAILALIVISTYNKLVRTKNSVEEAHSGIDISLLKRHDLITDLVQVVKGYTKHESQILEELVSIRSELSSNPDLANDHMNSIINRLNITIEAYPDLKASDQFLNLQKNIANVEEHLQASRRFYNNNVTNYNNLIEGFPSNIVANMFNYQPKELFKTDVENLVKPTVEY